MSTPLELNSASRLLKAEWYLAASRLNDISKAVQPELARQMLQAEEGLDVRQNFVRGLQQEEAQMRLVSGMLAIEGVPPHARHVKLYKDFTDPQNRGHHLIRNMSINRTDPLLDVQQRPIRITDSIAELCMFYRAAIGMAWSGDVNAAELSEWYHEDELARADDGPLRAAQAAELYLRVERWGIMIGHSEPQIASEIQALLAQINALQQETIAWSELLAEEVHNRELDLLRVYLTEHTDVVVPADVQAELDALPGGPARAEMIRQKLAEMRAEIGLPPDYSGPPAGTSAPGPSRSGD